MTVTQRLTSPPRYLFRDGPAYGIRPVFPTLDGALPAYETVAEPVDVDPWLQDSPVDPAAPRPIEHIYRRVENIDIIEYEFVWTLGAGRVRITCPWCGQTSHQPDDVDAGYCPGCHDWTRIPRLAVLRAADGVELPFGYEGRWYDLSSMDTLPNIGDTADRSWVAVSTGQFERGIAGGYAEVFEARTRT